jgi:transposase, IS6 family
LKTIANSWHVDETYIKVKIVWVYLYRAVESQGKTLDFLLSSTSNSETARRFFLKTLAASHTSEPRVINVDQYAAYPKAFNELKAEGYEIQHSCNTTVRCVYPALLVATSSYVPVGVLLDKGGDGRGRVALVK